MRWCLLLIGLLLACSPPKVTVELGSVRLAFDRLPGAWHQEQQGPQVTFHQPDHSSLVMRNLGPLATARFRTTLESALDKVASEPESAAHLLRRLRISSEEERHPRFETLTWCQEQADETRQALSSNQPEEARQRIEAMLLRLATDPPMNPTEVARFHLFEQAEPLDSPIAGYPGCRFTYQEDNGLTSTQMVLYQEQLLIFSTGAEQETLLDRLAQTVEFDPEPQSSPWPQFLAEWQAKRRILLGSGMLLALAAALGAWITARPDNSVAGARGAAIAAGAVVPGLVGVTTCLFLSQAGLPTGSFFVLTFTAWMALAAIGMGLGLMAYFGALMGAKFGRLGSAAGAALVVSLSLCVTGSLL